MDVGRHVAKRAASIPLDLLGDADDDSAAGGDPDLERGSEQGRDRGRPVLSGPVPAGVSWGSAGVAAVGDDQAAEHLSPRGFSPYAQRTCSCMTQDDVHTYTVPTIKPISIALDIWKRTDIDFAV
jgi:hypothetical protein